MLHAVACKPQAQMHACLFPCRILLCSRVVTYCLLCCAGQIVSAHAPQGCWLRLVLVTAGLTGLYTAAKYTVAMTFRICFTFGILTTVYNWWAPWPRA